LPNFLQSSQTGKPGTCSVTKSTLPSSHATCTDGETKILKKQSSSSGPNFNERTAPITSLPSMSSRRIGTTQRTLRDHLGSGFTSRVNSTAERRDVLLKPQVSTSSRPSLIKTGSLPQSSKLPKMNVTERPKPLRRTSEQPTSVEVFGKNIITRPKWV
uniref:MARK3 kinase n=1 Tax=Angiostrongylus cantonensis TaxID=6313 RepID=A0A0K0DNN6_ANGCA